MADNKISQGKAVTEEEHKELLKALKKYEDMKNRTTLKNTVSYKDVMEALETYDEVVINLKRDSGVLVVGRNFSFKINGVSYKLNPTSEEKGTMYKVDYVETDESGKNITHYSDAVSNNFTGQQLFKKILEGYLDLE